MENKLSVQELMKPRYEVIADYSTSDVIGLEVGTIITKYNLFPFCESYRHIFKPLKWWERREASELPDYVSYKLVHDSISKIIKVDNHLKDSWGNYNERGFTADQIFYSYSKCEPSTFEEYESYNQNK